MNLGITQGNVRRPEGEDRIAIPGAGIISIAREGILAKEEEIGEIVDQIKVVTRGDGSNRDKIEDGPIEITSTWYKMMDSTDTMVMIMRNTMTMCLKEMVGITHVMGAREPMAIITI